MISLDAMKIINNLENELQNSIDDKYSAMVQCEPFTTAKKILSESILSSEFFLKEHKKALKSL